MLDKIVYGAAFAFLLLVLVGMLKFSFIFNR